MKELSLLQTLGLKDAEAQTYLALLKNGPSSIRRLAELTSINRGTTYDALKNLVPLGLVFYNRQGERHKYIAESPEHILQLIADRRHKLAQAEADAKHLLPGLLALSEHRLGAPLIRFYEDDDGIATILRDVLQTTRSLTPREYLAYSSRPLRKYIYRRFPHFTRARIQDGISVKVIAVGEGGEIDQLAERRWLPEPTTAINPSSYTLIYGHKIATISVSSDDTPFGVIIEESGTAAMQQLIFDTLWNILPPSSSGPTAPNALP